MANRKLNLTERKCSCCGILKPIEQFVLVHTRAGAPQSQEYRTYYKSWCINCQAEKARLRRSDPEYKQKERLAYKNSYRKKPEYYLWKRAFQRANEYGISFNIKPEDVIIPIKCPILKIKIKIGDGQFNYNSPSLDRINNSKGYVKGNVAVISRLANQMKSCATHAQLKVFSKNILPYLNDTSRKRIKGKTRIIPTSIRFIHKIR